MSLASHLPFCRVQPLALPIKLRRLTHKDYIRALYISIYLYRSKTPSLKHSLLSAPTLPVVLVPLLSILRVDVPGINGQVYPHRFGAAQYSCIQTPNKTRCVLVGFREPNLAGQCQTGNQHTTIPVRLPRHSFSEEQNPSSAVRHFPFVTCNVPETALVC